MFVLCPSCAGPFRIPADQIAPLVQIACPHCEFRMILDIEAANEPSLAEPGQLFAQGFEDAAAYFSVYSHVGPQADVTPQPAVQAPEPIAAPVTRTPPSTPPQPAAVTPTRTPTPAPVAAESSPRHVGAKTIIQAPKRPVSMDPKAEPVQASTGPSMRAGRSADVTDALSLESKVSAVEPERRAPPHTPPAATAVSNAPTSSEPATPPRPEDIAAQSGSHPPSASQDAKGKSADGEKKPAVPQPATGNSNFIYIIVIVGVMLAAAIAIYLNMK